MLYYIMEEKEEILFENIKEYWKNALLADRNKEYNTAVVLFFKAISALADLYLLKKEGNIPNSHTDRFRILEKKYREIYKILDKDFPFYQDSYRAKLDLETSEILKKDAKRLSEITGIEL